MSDSSPASLSAKELPATFSLPGVGSEWKNGWPVVFASTLGVALASIIPYSFGLFMAPLEQEFGWTRTETTSGLLVWACLSVPVGPMIGALIDKWGPRKLALPGTILFSASFAALAFNTGALSIWWLLWAWLGIASMTIQVPIWTTAVTSMFDKERGLAIALALCGTAVASTGVPLLSRWLIDAFGWRTAFAALGFGWGLVVLPVAFFLFYGAQDRGMKGAIRPPLPIVGPGLSMSQAFRSRPFLTILGVSLAINLVSCGINIHLVPLLVSRGLTRENAALVASVFGLAAASGKLGTGWALDRVHGRVISIVQLALPVIPSVMLTGLSPTMVSAFVAVFLIGFGAGSQLQIFSYLTSRYVGLKNFGKLYAVFLSGISIMVGVGPLLAGMIFDAFGDYRILLYLMIPIALLCSLMMSTLGPYPNFADEATSEQSSP